MRERIILELPRIIREEEVTRVVNRIKEVKDLVSNYLAHNLDQIMILKSLGIVDIHGSSSLNVFNSYSLNFFNEENLKEVEYSKELNIKELGNIKKGGQLQVYGNVELMILEHCIVGSQLGTGSCKKNIYALKDRIDVEFPILVDELGKNHIINSRVLMLVEELEKLKKFGFSSFAFNFILREDWELDEVTDLYIRFFKEEINVDTLKKELNSIVYNYTKGHYNRGVI